MNFVRLRIIVPLLAALWVLQSLPYHWGTVTQNQLSAPMTLLNFGEPLRLLQVCAVPPFYWDKTKQIIHFSDQQLSKKILLQVLDNGRGYRADHLNFR